MSKLSQYLNQHLVGEVIVEPETRQKFATDNGPLEYLPEMVVYPYSTSDIRKLTLFAWQLAQKGHRLSITPRGGGTNGTGAAIGSGAVLALTKHMNSMLEFDAKQRLVRLQPGMSFEALRAALALQEMELPAFASAPSDATIGGALADGRRSGESSDVVDKLEVVLANGDVIQTERLTKRDFRKKLGQQGMEGDIYRGVDRLIEDNKQLVDAISTQDGGGYASIADVKRSDGSFDLTPLFLGSQGTLGIISEMILKLEYAPTAWEFVIGMFYDAGSARDALDQVMKVGASSVEWIDASLFRQAAALGKEVDFVKEAENEGPLATVLVATMNDTSARARAKKAKKIARIYTQFGAYVKRIEESGAPVLPMLDSTLRLVFESSDNGGHALPLMRGAHVPLDRFEEFTSAVASLSTKYHTGLPLHGSVADGIWHVRPSLNLDKVSGKQAVFKLVDDYAELVSKFGGYMASVSGEGRLQGFSTHKRFDEDQATLYEDIKLLFDPHDILNSDVKKAGDIHATVKRLRGAYTPTDGARQTHF